MADAETTETTVEPESRIDAIGKAFDEHTSTDGADGTVVEAEAGETTDAGDAQQAEATETETEAEPLDPPAHWAAADQERFREADPKWQEWFLSRSKDMDAAHTRRSQEVAPLRNVLQQWGPTVQQWGADPVQVINGAMQAVYTLRAGTPEQKAGLIKQLAQDYGVSLDPPKQPSAEEDPFGVQAMIDQKLAPFSQQLQQMGGGMQQQQQAAQQAASQAGMQVIERFRIEKGADGKPAHPYIDELLDDMTALAQARAAAGQTPDIAELYEAASWSNPSVRAKVQAALKAADRAKTKKAEQERARRARTASSGLAGSGGGTAAQPRSRREEIEAAYDAASA